MANDNNGGVIDFSTAKQARVAALDLPEAPEVTDEELIQQGKASFDATLAAGATGFLSIIFDKEENPVIVIAGDVEPFKTVGVLEFCKNELINSMIYQNGSPDDFELVEDEELDD